MTNDFIDHIEANPTDKTAKLAFADYIEERPDLPYHVAALLRLHVAISEGRARPRLTKKGAGLTIQLHERMQPES